MITSKEIRSFWMFYWFLMFRWGCVSLFFILSVLSIPFAVGFYLGGGFWMPFAIYGLVVPFNFLLKYGLGVRNLWFFNDTKDGDFGPEWWVKEYGLEKESKFTRFILWWKRNHSWNFIRQFDPPWYGGQTEDFIILKTTLTRGGKWQRADKDLKIYGIKSIAYRIDGKVFCQYSKASENYQIQIGAGGSEYRFRMKL